MEVNANVKMTNQYVRNVINSFAKTGKDVAKDMLPSTSSLVESSKNSATQIKDFKYTFTNLKEKLITPRNQDIAEFDNITDRINGELYTFGHEVSNVTDKNVKYFSKTTKNLTAIKADLISTEIVKTVKRILLNSNNTLIDSIGTLIHSSDVMIDFQNKVKLNVFKDTTNNIHTILELIAESNNSFAEYSYQKLSGLESDVTENRMQSLIKVERMFSMDEMDNTFRRLLKNKFGIESSEVDTLLKIAIKNPALGLFKTLMAANADKAKGTLLDDALSIPKNFNNYVAFALQKFKENENPFVRFLGEKFAPEKRDSKIIYRDNYNQESTKFDSYSKRAITHVIPSLLAKILNKLENKSNSEELVYDYKNGGFTNLGSLEKLKEKNKPAMQQRINNLKDANKQRKAFKNDFKYNDRFSNITETEYKKKEYKQNNHEAEINVSKAPSFIRKTISKIDNLAFNLDNPDKKMQNVIEKVLGIAANFFDDYGSPDLEAIKNAILEPIKKKFGEYINIVKNFVKETYTTAVDSVIKAFKRPEGSESFSKKIKDFVSTKILFPIGNKINDIKTGLMLELKDRVSVVAKNLKRKIAAKRGSSYVSNANIHDVDDIDIDLNNDVYGFNMIKYTMLNIGRELKPSERIFDIITTNSYDVMRNLKKIVKKVAKKQKGELIEPLLDLRRKPTFKWIESLVKYTSLAGMFIKDVIRSVEPMVLTYKAFQTVKRFAINILGNITDAFKNVFKEADKFVKNVISIFTEKIPAALKFVDRFTGTIANLMKSKLAKLPFKTVKAITMGGTYMIHKANSILIDGVGEAIKFAGDAVRSLLVTARLLGNVANKAMMYGKFYLKRVLRVGVNMLKNTLGGRSPFINRLEFATITGGNLDGIRKIVVAEVIRKDTHFDDEDKDDENDRAKVLATAGNVVGKMEGRIEERTEALEDLIQKFITKPVDLLKGLFKNVIGFILGGATGDFIANALTKVYGWASNSKIGKMFGLDKTNQIFAKKVYIDGGTVDVDNGIVGDIGDDIIEGGVEAASNKGFWKKVGGFFSKHKKGAIITGIAAGIGIFAYSENKKKKEKEENDNIANDPNKDTTENKSTATPVNNTQSVPSNDKTQDNPSSPTVNQNDSTNSENKSTATPVAEKSEPKKSDVKKAVDAKKDKKTKTETSTATPVTNTKKIEDTEATEEEILKSVGMTKPVSSEVSSVKPDKKPTNAIKAETLVATVPPKSEPTKKENNNDLNAFQDIELSENEMKEIYEKNKTIDTKNKSKLYNKLNYRDKEEMIAAEGVQGLYNKTADPKEREKLSADHKDYRGMIKDFNKGFKYGGMIFGIVNVLAKNAPLTKFRDLIKDKQNFMENSAKIRKALLELGPISGILNKTDSNQPNNESSSDGSSEDGGTDGGGTSGGSNIEWPSGNMKLGEKMALYAKAFLPSGTIKYSQPKRDGIDNQKNTADCSSYVRHIYKTVAGVNPGNNSREQKNAGTRVDYSKDALKPGDILWREGHVALYAGNGEIMNVGGNPDPDLRNIATAQKFTCGRRVINPDQMVDNSLKNPNTALTGLSGSISSSGSKNKDMSSSIGDPAEEMDNDKKSTAVPTTPIKNSDFTYESKSMKDRERSRKQDPNENYKEDPVVEKPKSTISTTTESQDVSLQKLVNQKRQDNTLYGRQSTINKLQKEIVNILESIDIDIEALLKLEDHLIVHMMKQVEGL